LQGGSTNDKGKSLDIEEIDAVETVKVPSSKNNKQRDAVDSVAEQIRGITISEPPVVATPSTNSADNLQAESSAPEIDKKIRALKKKVLLLPCSQTLSHVCVLLKMSCRPYCVVWFCHRYA
jgi:partner of Y14 and mago protein